MEISEIQKKLAEPFKKQLPDGAFVDDLKWLPSVKAGNGFMCQPYIDRAHVIKRLNDVLGIDGWMFDHKKESNGTTTGILSLKINGSWISRSDTGTQSNTEKEKGATSDALKRAATLFGIGTYIYDIDARYVPAKQHQSGKPVPCVTINGKDTFLYGDQLSNYLNKIGQKAGFLVALGTAFPECKQDAEFLTLWNKYKNQ